jgi:hypothetical protein
MAVRRTKYGDGGDRSSSADAGPASPGSEPARPAQAQDGSAQEIRRSTRPGGYTTKKEGYPASVLDFEQMILQESRRDLDAGTLLGNHAVFTLPVSARSVIQVDQNVDGWYVLTIKNPGQYDIRLVIDDSRLLMHKLERAFLEVLKGNGAIRDYIKTQLEYERSQTSTSTNPNKSATPAPVPMTSSFTIAAGKKIGGRTSNGTSTSKPSTSTNNTNQAKDHPYTARRRK